MCAEFSQIYLLDDLPAEALGPHLQWPSGLCFQTQCIKFFFKAVPLPTLPIEVNKTIIYPVMWLRNSSSICICLFLATMLNHHSFIQKHLLSTCYREDTWLTPGGWQYTVVPFMKLNQSLSLDEPVYQPFLYRSPPPYFHCLHCANWPLITSPGITAIGPF